MSPSRVLDTGRLQGHIDAAMPPLTEKNNIFVQKSASVNDRSNLASLDPDGKMKAPAMYVDESADTEDGSQIVQSDPFDPFDDLPEERKRVITIRAMVLGCICGALVGSSNIYLGLKTGWTFSSHLFGAIIGFAVLKSLSRTLPEAFPILGGSFGMTFHRSDFSLETLGH